MPTGGSLARPVAARSFRFFSEEIERSDAVSCLILVGCNPFSLPRFFGGVGRVGGFNVVVLYSVHINATGLVRLFAFGCFVLHPWIVDQSVGMNLTGSGFHTFELIADNRLGVWIQDV
jgi:hypothetical protein